MPLVFTHLIAVWIIGKAFEFFSKTKLSQRIWLFLFVGGVLPDIDYLLGWLFNMPLHRTFTHSFLFIFIILSLGLFSTSFLNFKDIEKNRLKTDVVALFIGALIHLLLDLITSFNPGIPLFWPANYYFSLGGIYHNVSFQPLFSSSLEITRRFLREFLFDMGLGAFLFFILLLKGRIKV